jgi:hypothetical protein
MEQGLKTAGLIEEDVEPSTPTSMTSEAMEVMKDIQRYP